MLPEILLAALYTIILSYIIPRCSYFRASAMGAAWLQGLFVVKVLFGIGYGYFYWILYDGGDTWNYLKYSRLIYDTLYINPLYYLELTFGPNARRPPDYLCEIIEPIMHWSDVRTYTVLRVNALIQLVSGGYYSVHAVFFVFLSFTGLIGIYRTFRTVLLEDGEGKSGTSPQLVPFVVSFGIPSVWFWSSGVHKEALSVFSIGLLMFYTQQLIRRYETVKVRAVVIVILSLLFLLLLRSYIVMLLVPCLIAWYWSVRYSPQKTWQVYMTVYAVAFLLALIAPALHPKLDLFAKIADIQYYYLHYSEGSTDLALTPLQPTVQSLMQRIPQAIYHLMVLPIYYGSSSWWLFLPTSIENIILLLLMAVNGYRYRSYSSFNRPLFWFCLCFALSYTILIGLINDNMGAIARYRSTILIFWVGACLLPLYGAYLTPKKT